MKILITGGAGFIGRHLAEFLAGNHKVAIYDNLSNSSKKNIEFLIEKNVEFVKGDILDYENLKKNCIGLDLIIHLAAKSDVADSVIHPKITNEVNITGSENVIKCCIENKIKKIIFASSSAVYEDSKIPIKENAKTNPLSPYGKSKLVIENKLKKISQEHGINVISLRMFNVFGEGQNDQYSGVISKFVKNILNKKPIEINGDGTQTRDFVGIFDVVHAFNCAIKNIDGKKGNVYNIGTGSSITINELVKMILEIVDKEIIVNYKEQKQGEIKYSVSDITLAKKELGFYPKQKLQDELIKLL